MSTGFAGARLTAADRARGLLACEEFKRIDRLPRRDWANDRALESDRIALTNQLKRRRGSQELWPIQAVCLREAYKLHGLVAGVRVGGGKFLIWSLLATMFHNEPEAKRPLLFCPGKSITSGKVERCLVEAREHWHVSKRLQIVSFERMQTIGNAELMLKYRPTFVAADEAHFWRSDNGRAARVARFIRAYPDVPFFLLSGTLMAGNIVSDVAKLCDWALREGSPLPRYSSKSKTLKQWADAIEERDDQDQAEQRMQPGVLRKWFIGAEQGRPGLIAAYGRRYVQTPGVVVSNDCGLPTGLEINITVNAKHRAVESAFERLRAAEPTTPDNWPLVDAHVVAGVAKQLELGFFYQPNPRPPADYTLAYKAWVSFARERIKLGDIDTELAVLRECAALELDEQPVEYLDWVKVRHTFKLNNEAVWLSTKRLDQAAAWLNEHPRGLCWTQFRAFGRELSKRTGRPFFGAGGLDDARRSIDDPTVTGPAIVSVRACSEDLNLQRRYSDNLFVCPLGGARLEQAIARTHRPYQSEPTVTADFWVGCAENAKTLRVARAKELAVSIAQNDKQRKLVCATWMNEYERPRVKHSWRWQQKRK